MKTIYYRSKILRITLLTSGFNLEGRTYKTFLKMQNFSCFEILVDSETRTQFQDFFLALNFFIVKIKQFNLCHSKQII
jgi:hypothetical protein